MCTDINPDISQPITAKGQMNWTGTFISPDIIRIERSGEINGGGYNNDIPFQRRCYRIRWEDSKKDTLIGIFFFFCDVFPDKANDILSNVIHTV